jgi:hypothetical protein
MDKIEELKAEQAKIAAELAIELAKMEGNQFPTESLSSSNVTVNNTPTDIELLDNMMEALGCIRDDQGKWVNPPRKVYVPVVPVKPVEILDNVAQEPVSKPYNGPSLSPSDLNRWEQIQLERIKNGTYTEKYKSSNR